MKTNRISNPYRPWLYAAVLAPLALAFTAQALDIAYANKGADNAFAPTENDFVIDLAAANTAAWDSVPAAPGKGVYDEDKWAVVFKFSSVNIPANVTVRFLNNASRAPVVWLVDGDVKIDGKVELSGQGDLTGRLGVYTEPGPGGFSGGRALIDGSAQGAGSGGFGPGGGMRNGGAGFASDGTPGEIGGDGWMDPVRAGGSMYGDAQMLHLIGGSGGGGDSAYIMPAKSSGAGGGALLIAARGSTLINGWVRSNGGNGVSYSQDRSGGGSGGTVRLIAETIGGDGQVLAIGGVGQGYRRYGSSGRIRIEANSSMGRLQPVPSTPLARPDNPVRLWPDDTTPSARIVSVGTENTPATLTGQIQLALPDVTLRTSATEHPVVVETRNLPDNSEVIVRIVPASGSPREVLASLTSRNGVVATWTATNNVPPGLFVAQVRAKAR